MATDQLDHRFVELMPSTIDEGILYISLEYRTVLHRCCCGCREKVVTPIGPTDWSVTFHGDSVSLDPSVGNWALPCSSHYLIKRGRVVWARQWSQGRIDASRHAEQETKELLYGDAPPVPAPPRGSDTAQAIPPKRWWQFWRS